MLQPLLQLLLQTLFSKSTDVCSYYHIYVAATAAANGSSGQGCGLPSSSKARCIYVSYICVLILLYMCPHSTIIYMCPHASHNSICMWTRMRAAKLLESEVYICVFIHTTICMPSSSKARCIYVSSYILVNVCQAPRKRGLRQHTSAYVGIRQHTSAYVSIRQHTSAYVCGQGCGLPSSAKARHEDTYIDNSGMRTHIAV
jgi:hypothetical protein